MADRPTTGLMSASTSWYRRTASASRFHNREHILFDDTCGAHTRLFPNAIIRSFAVLGCIPRRDSSSYNIATPSKSASNYSTFLTDDRWRCDGSGLCGFLCASLFPSSSLSYPSMRPSENSRQSVLGIFTGPFTRLASCRTNLEWAQIDDASFLSGKLCNPS